MMNRNTVARWRFNLIAFKHCVLKKSKYDNQYYRKMDLEGQGIRSQMAATLRDFKTLNQSAGFAGGPIVSFEPFKVKIGSRFRDLFASLGAPHYADFKTHQPEGIKAAHYKLQVGSIKCRLSLYFYEDQIALIKTKLSTKASLSGEESTDILSLLFGHRLPQGILDQCQQGAFAASGENTVLRIERRIYDCQVMAFNPENPGVQSLARHTEQRAHKEKAPCQVQNWYRKKFGTHS